MRHLRKEITLCLVRGIRGGFFQPEKLRFIDLLLLADLQRLRFPAAFLLLAVSKVIEQCEQNKHKRINDNIDSELCIHRFKQRIIVNHNDQMPLI